MSAIAAGMVECFVRVWNTGTLRLHYYGASWNDHNSPSTYLNEDMVAAPNSNQAYYVRGQLSFWFYSVHRCCSSCKCSETFVMHLPTLHTCKTCLHTTRNRQSQLQHVCQPNVSNMFCCRSTSNSHHKTWLRATQMSQSACQQGTVKLTAGPA